MRHIQIGLLVGQGRNGLLIGPVLTSVSASSATGSTGAGSARAVTSFWNTSTWASSRSPDRRIRGERIPGDFLQRAKLLNDFRDGAEQLLPGLIDTGDRSTLQTSRPVLHGLPAIARCPHPSAAPPTGDSGSRFIQNLLDGLRHVRPAMWSVITSAAAWLAVPAWPALFGVFQALLHQLPATASRSMKWVNPQAVPGTARSLR